EPPVCGVGVEGLVEVTGSKLSEGVAFPVLALSSVLGELDRSDAVSEPVEDATGVDLGKLSWIADEHDLGSGAGGLVEEGGEGSGPGHTGLVDHQHGPVVEVLVAGVEVHAEGGECP